MRANDLMKAQEGTKGITYPCCLSRKPERPEFHAKKIPFLSNIPEIALTQLIGKTKTARYLRKEVLTPEVCSLSSFFQDKAKNSLRLYVVVNYEKILLKN